MLIPISCARRFLLRPGVLIPTLVILLPVIVVTVVLIVILLCVRNPLFCIAIVVGVIFTSIAPSVTPIIATLGPKDIVSRIDVSVIVALSTAGVRAGFILAVALPSCLALHGGIAHLLIGGLLDRRGLFLSLFAALTSVVVPLVRPVVLLEGLDRNIEVLGPVRLENLPLVTVAALRLTTLIGTSLLRCVSLVVGSLILVVVIMRIVVLSLAHF